MVFIVTIHIVIFSIIANRTQLFAKVKNVNCCVISIRNKGINLIRCITICRVIITEYSKAIFSIEFCHIKVILIIQGIARKRFRSAATCVKISFIRRNGCAIYILGVPEKSRERSTVANRFAVGCSTAAGNGKILVTNNAIKIMNKKSNIVLGYISDQLSGLFRSYPYFDSWISFILCSIKR